MLQNKKILLGVCGSIAAYKAAHLVRLLVKAGAEVKVIMTASASEFITPLTLATLSKNPVLTAFVKNKAGEWNNHVELGLWADVMVIAPASANTMAKMANGICDNLLLATYLSARCPVMLAPAMDLDMYLHPATLTNLDKLKGFGNQIIEAEYGELASGLVGKGRMAEPEHILPVLSRHFNTVNALLDKRILITAGPTYEAIDPVRFIGNHSSGKMGYAIAEAAAECGAKVHLVSGPSPLSLSNNNVEIEHVTSTEEMYEACLGQFDNTDISILAAAVADYKPSISEKQKIKKKSDTINLDLIKTTDIAAQLGQRKKEGQMIVGFALETENEQANAIKKIETKNFDMIVLNSLNNKGAGFGYDTNKISIIDKENNVRDFELKSKKEVAQDIIDTIIHALDE
ncbi:bifunctional phosphopantothenoylcysteine decarboxylase/phosphopantothenate--cysteine ligase CoaBC [Fulvivirga sp. M361]|uniref:bifunctional phosphopantothenoylcysteine decarboxylase/phosphopantothenate--cysteine ligase CoaBC n=1 Tax=Fulvivirga sp. M361 TaxID=2594266 RepID=UPI00117B8855|nr:bifunctional phosphopantothenoylcysteine decarboxylase/phosphopantothenate--cysteine ligase CoaBC [Fulvivirga sp. M361]TRX52018.1 bifunctional phosphopantothenoylcysteine decarboxylase/phosphopantothenate--cysteine ligase CoaBC [Fulvivirga sp. M361]